MSIPRTLATAFLLLASLHMQVPAAEPAAKAAQPADTAPWENISDEFFKKIEVHDLPTTYLRRCVGMAVAPTGEIFVIASKGHGVCVSKDHGASWTVVPGNNVTGRC